MTTDSNQVRVAVVGASGYSGEELLRLLTRHPGVSIAAVTSRRYADTPVEEVFPRLSGTALTFRNLDAEELARQADVVFLALPHGLAAEFAAPLVARGRRVVDLSADFRLRSLDQYRLYYKCEHPAPELLKQAVYGSPEIYRSRIRTARLVACPGCYPTSVILAVRPLLAASLAEKEAIVCASMSGVTGAGRKVDLPYIFPECNESLRPYGVTGHRHLPEIEQELALAAGIHDLRVNFIPHLVPVNRGIHSTIVLAACPNTTPEDVTEALNEAYADEPFVRVLPPGSLADTKHVVLTNVCEIGCAFDTHTGRIVLSSAIDNLTKGAAGQALQCMNIACGFDETTGLIG